MELHVRRLDPGLPLPSYQHPGDAGLDLCAASDATIPPGERAVIGTGLAVAIPDGFAGLVVPRSGLAARSGLTLANTPGIVDAGYRGEIRLILCNLDPRDSIEIERGQRVAQMLVVPVAAVDVVERDELPGTARGRGGFGSTGA